LCPKIEIITNLQRLSGRKDEYEPKTEYLPKLFESGVLTHILGRYLKYLISLTANMGFFFLCVQHLPLNLNFKGK